MVLLKILFLFIIVLITLSFQGNTNHTEVALPSPSSAVSTTGSCASNEIEISWGPSSQQNKVHIQFSMADDKVSWKVSNISAVIRIDDHFLNARDNGKIEKLTLIILTS